MDFFGTQCIIILLFTVTMYHLHSQATSHVNVIQLCCTVTDDKKSVLWCFQNADAICSGVDPAILTTQEANRYRDIMFTRIQEVTQSNRCASLNCMNSANDDVVQWAQCDNCMLWFHFSCEQLSDKPMSLWCCSFCRSAASGHWHDIAVIRKWLIIALPC